MLFDKLANGALRKKIDIDYKKLFRDINLTANISNSWNDESDKEESLLNDHDDNSENLCFVVSKLYIEREKHTNTNYSVTSWMLRVTTHIR